MISILAQFPAGYISTTELPAGVPGERGQHVYDLANNRRSPRPGTPGLSRHPHPRTLASLNHPPCPGGA